jgi:RimJ/RimL family protein N-acetyltransferase
MADLHGRAEVVDPLGMEPSTGVQEERARLNRWADLFGDALDVGMWGIEASDGNLVGLVLLKTLRPQGDHDGYEVGWRLHPDAWGNGYATEAAAAVIDLAFTERDLDVVYAVVKPTNSKSRAVADRLAMRPVGDLVFDGVLHDLLAIERP